MKNFFSALLWFLVLALIALLFSHFMGKPSCEVCQNTSKSSVNQNQEISDKDATDLKFSEFVLTDMDGNTVFKFTEGFVINSINSTVKTPEAMGSIQDSIKSYLERYQDKKLLLNAKHTESEGEPRGLDRASYLKNILVKSGIHSDKIVPGAILSTHSYDAGNNYHDGIVMLFQNAAEAETAEKSGADVTETNTTEAKGTKDTTSFPSKTLYSEFNSYGFILDKTLNSYASDLKEHLKKYPNKFVSVTGHGDSMGPKEVNYHFGLRRAQSVIRYFESQKLPKAKFKAYSKGETEPAATNATEKGRDLNRRIVVEVK